MKKLVRAACLVVVAFALAGPAWAQHPLTGSWEWISQKTDGKDVPPDNTRAIMVFDAEGHMAWIHVAVDRPKATRPVSEMTREELVAQFNQVGGGFISTEVVGDKLRFKDDGLFILTSEPDDPGYNFRVEGDVLVLNQVNDKGKKFEVRYRRLK